MPQILGTTISSTHLICIVCDIWTLFGWCEVCCSYNPLLRTAIKDKNCFCKSEQAPAWYLLKVCSLRASRCSSASTFPSSRPRTAVSSRLAGLMRCAVRRHTWISCFSSAEKERQGLSFPQPGMSVLTTHNAQVPQAQPKAEASPHINYYNETRWQSWLFKITMEVK